MIVIEIFNITSAYIETISGWEKWNTIGTLIIAGFTLYFSYFIYKTQKKKDDTNLKLEWYKTIILDKRISSLFLFFDNVSDCTCELKQIEYNDENLRIVNDNVLDELRKVRLDFVELINSVDITLYYCLKKQLDDMCDGITNSIFNEEIDLRNDLMFNEHIENPISKYKTKIFKFLVDFRG